MSELHIFTAGMQPAHNYKLDVGLDKPIRIKSSPHALAVCYGCGRRRRLRNMRVQAFYDGARFWCHKGGCR